jgi:hypothetical protein
VALRVSTRLYSGTSKVKELADQFSKQLTKPAQQPTTQPAVLGQFPLKGTDGRNRGFLLCVYCCIPSRTPWPVNQPK